MIGQACLTTVMATPIPTTPAWLDRAGWPYGPRSVDTGDGGQHYVDEGTGPAVLLVHGTPTWSYEWRHVIAALHQEARDPRAHETRPAGDKRPAHAVSV